MIRERRENDPSRIEHFCFGRKLKILITNLSLHHITTHPTIWLWNSPNYLQGMFAGMSLEGQILVARDDDNEAFYGRPVQPTELPPHAPQYPYTHTTPTDAHTLIPHRVI